MKSLTEVESGSVTSLFSCHCCSFDFFVFSSFCKFWLPYLGFYSSALPLDFTLFFEVLGVELGFVTDRQVLQRWATALVLFTCLPTLSNLPSAVSPQCFWSRW